MLNRKFALIPNKPTEEANVEGQTVLVNQVGWAGVNLGRIDFRFDKRKFKKKRYA